MFDLSKDINVFTLITLVMGRLKFVCFSLLLVYFLVIHHASAILRFSVAYLIVFSYAPEETDSQL